MMIMTNVLLLVQMLAFSKIPPFGKSNHHGDQLHLMYVRLQIIHTYCVHNMYLSNNYHTNIERRYEKTEWVIRMYAMHYDSILGQKVHMSL